MGKTKIIKLIVRETRTQRYLWPWQTKYAGRPTTENLEKDREFYNASLLKGGCNEHIGLTGWVQTDIEVYDQVKKIVVCTLKAPMFEIIPDSNIAAAFRESIQSEILKRQC